VSEPVEDMKPIFIQQRDQTDCGVTCLLSIIKMHGGEASLETLREQSGTSLQGTSLLGVKQSAEKQNLKAEAFEVDDIEVFKKEATFPCILHVLIDEKLEHYVVCHSVSSRASDTVGESSSFEIIDPSKGLETWTEEELLERWKTRAVLCLEPTEAFEKVSQNKFKKLAWIKDLLREDVPMLSIAMVLGVLLAVLGLATAIFSQKLIDEILPNEQTTKLWLGLGLLGFLLLVNTALGYLRTFFLLRQSKDFNNRLMDDFYDKLLHLPKTFFDSRKTGEIIARLNDTRRIQSVISYLAGNVVIDALVFIISAIFVFTYSWEIGLVALISIPLFGWLVWKYNNRILEGQKAVMSQYAATESHFVDAVSGIGAIKAANKENFFAQVGKAVYSIFQEQIYQLGTLGNRYGLLNGVFNSLMVIGILGLASFMVLSKQLLLGEMMAILSIGMGMVGAIGRLATTNLRIQEAKVAFDRMFEFASVKPEVNRSEDVLTISPELEIINSLAVNGMSFRFAGKAELLKNVTINLVKGSITVLMGEVGSGKSILMEILQKFRTFESGQITLNENQSLNDIEANSWRKKIGVVPQEIKIFSGTLIDNITLGNFMEEAERAIELCRKYGFDKYFEALPQDYLTIVGEEGVNLSGGQKQMLSLAGALYNEPEILFLDEPTAAMDSKTEEFVLNLLKELKKDKIILMITHRRNFDNLADQVVVLKNGITHQTILNPAVMK
jgi:ABC-type bacteriocin/lantibiotic exporter with double-glycine peptidase domain